MKTALKIICLSLFLGIAGLFAVSFFVPFVHAQVQISAVFPGQATGGSTATGPGSFIASFYIWALSISGILAFGIIVYGGVKYMVSVGNPSGEGDAKEWIKAAILGILLLAGAYMILNVINPNLLNIGLPGLGSVGQVSQQQVPNTAQTANNCPTCVQLPNCAVSSRTNCGGTPAMDAVVTCIDKTDSNFTVNEAFPPVVDHSDPGHNDGCAIDVHVSDCAAASQLISAAQACGARKVLNEYTNCGGTTYTHTTGGNIHIDAPNCPSRS